MAALARISRDDQRVRDAAATLIRGVQEKDWRGEILAIFYFVRDRIRYQLDPYDTELLQSGFVTLRLGYGDCDDKCILLAAMLESVGHPCQFAAIGFELQEGYSHVVTEVSGAGETPWITLDATEKKPPGWYPPRATWILRCPV